MFNKSFNAQTQSAQMNDHRDIAKNPFVRYTKATIETQLYTVATIIATPGVEVQLIADKAMELVLLNDAMELFKLGTEVGFDVQPDTKAVTVLEHLTGKTWQELNAPTTSDRVADTMNSFFGKALGVINKGATKLAEKTQR